MIVSKNHNFLFFSFLVSCASFDGAAVTVACELKQRSQHRLWGWTFVSPSLEHLLLHLQISGASFVEQLS
jgi:hypothetical protein